MLMLLLLDSCHSLHRSVPTFVLLLRTWVEGVHRLAECLQTLEVVRVEGLELVWVPSRWRDSAIQLRRIELEVGRVVQVKEVRTEVNRRVERISQAYQLTPRVPIRALGGFRSLEQGGRKESKGGEDGKH
jgi:hypothetical protein